MVGFIDTRLQKLNIGLALDEGLASPGDTFKVFYGERKTWWIKVTAQGNVGHGSRFVQGTAVEKLVKCTLDGCSKDTLTVVMMAVVHQMKVINRVHAYRQEQEAILTGTHTHDHRCTKHNATGSTDAEAASKPVCDEAKAGDGNADDVPAMPLCAAVNSGLKLGDVCTMNLTKLVQ